MSNDKELQFIEKYLGADIARQFDTRNKSEVQIIAERYGEDMARCYANALAENAEKKAMYDEFTSASTDKYSAAKARYGDMANYLYDNKSDSQRFIERYGADMAKYFYPHTNDNCVKFSAGINKKVRYHTQFTIVQDSIVQINPEFSLCTVLVAYHGDNQNMTSISKETFEKCLWTIYAVPIIGEWIRPEDDPSKETWGSHGGKLIVSSDGITYEQTTKPFGFVTEEAYKNAAWIEVVEKNGHTKNEYLKLERCILWNSRYEECNSILEDNFGQSMEISINDGYYRDDNYFVITDFAFSALCILGTAQPCFESAMIGRQYEFDQFKNELQLMMERYKHFSGKGK